jgi:hypothetical protein
MHGHVKCSMKQALPVVIPIAGTPLDLLLRPEFSFTVDGSLTFRKTWTFHVQYGFFRSRYSGNADYGVFRVDSTQGIEAAASLELFLGMDLELSLSGRVGVGGSIGPVLTGTLKRPSNPCSTIDAAFRGDLTASADVFFKSWTFALASATFGHWTLWDGCATGAAPPGNGGTTTPGGGAGPPGGGTPPPPAGTPTYPTVTPLSSTSGPAGYEFFVGGPDCVGSPGERASVVAADADGTPRGSAYGTPQSESVTHWRLGIELDGRPRTGTTTVSCLITAADGSVRTVWSEPVTWTVTQAQRPTVVASASRSAGFVAFTSGADTGSDPCPVIPGLSVGVVEIFTGFADTEGTVGEDGLFYAMPAHAATLTKPLPAYVAPGDTASAQVWCDYKNASTQVGGTAMYFYGVHQYTVQP